MTLLLDPKSRVSNGITIPEGKTAKQIYEILAKATGIPVAEFEAAARTRRRSACRTSGSTARDGKKVDQVDRGLPVPGHVRVRPPNADRRPRSSR